MSVRGWAVPSPSKQAFESGSLYVALTELELAMETMLTSNSKQLSQVLGLMACATTLDFFTNFWFWSVFPCTIEQ